MLAISLMIMLSGGATYAATSLLSLMVEHITSNNKVPWFKSRRRWFRIFPDNLESTGVIGLFPIVDWERDQATHAKISGT